MAFEVIHSEVVYEGKVFDVRRDLVQMPNGRPVRLDIVDHAGSVTLVPVDEQGQVWFIRQYRHPARQVILELPAGVIDAGESAEEAARREIREEIGMAAGQVQKLGEFYLAPGYATEYMEVYLATHLTPDPLEADEDEVIDIEIIPAAEALKLAERGQIRDAKTLAALYLAQAYLAAR